jgi:Gpi18-like mannosyltransferase
VNEWKTKLTKITFVQILILGILIRVVLSPFFRHPFDVTAWKFLGMISYDLRINPVPYTSFYGPCWLFTLLGSYPVYLLVSLFRPSDLFLNLVIRLPIIFGDLITAVLLFKITKSKLAAGLWFLNPYVIFISAVHGQFDVLPTLFVLLSMYFLVKKQNLASAVSLAVGIGYKVFPVFLIPFFLLFSVRNFGKKIAAKYLLILLVSSILVFAIFFLPQNFKYLYEGLFVGLPGRSISYVGSSVSYIEYLSLHLGLLNNYNFLYAFIPLYIVLILFSVKFVRDSDKLNEAIIMTLLLLFVTYNTMHPQFLVWVIPFLLIAYVRKKRISFIIMGGMWLWMMLWIFSWNMQTWVVGPFQMFIPVATQGQTNELLLVSSMNFSAFTFACIADVSGLLRKIGLPFSKWLRFIILSVSTFTMDVLLYSFYGSWGMVVPILCFAVFYPLIVVSSGGRNS